MKAKNSDHKKIICIASGLLIAFLYFPNSKKENESPQVAPVAPIKDLPIYLSESGYNGICAGLLSIERKIDFSDVIFRQFYLPSSPVVNVSHKKSYYECKFSESDGLVTFRTSKDSGKTYSNWISQSDSGSTYRFKPSLAEKLVNMVIINPQGDEKQITLDKITSANVAIDAKQIQNVELNKVCQHAIALEFGKNPNIVKVKEPYKNGYNSIKVGYIRRDDNTAWNFECKIDKYDNSVIWRGLPGTNVTEIGRWRDGSNGFDHDDAKITYKVLKNAIEVTATYFNAGDSTSKIKRV